jgi:hypothetical protein
MKELSTSSMRRLYRASHNVLREDARAESQEIASREYERLLDLEAVKILSQVSLIVNGNETATAKLEALCDLLLAYDDEDEDESRGTKVDVKPTTAHENRDYLIGNNVRKKI